MKHIAKYGKAYFGAGSIPFSENLAKDIGVLFEFSLFHMFGIEFTPNATNALIGILQVVISAGVIAAVPNVTPAFVPTWTRPLITNPPVTPTSKAGQP